MSEETIRLYDDLAWLWPLWSDPTDPQGDYARWSEDVAQLITRYATRPVHTLLNLACGSGKIAYTLKRHFAVTGVDLSQPMLDHAIALNPECTFLLGDMRTCRLGIEFDSIFIDDGIVHMTTREDLAALFHTAYLHLRGGGVMLVAPDQTRETATNLTRVHHIDSPQKPANLDVVIVENYYDPDPTDETYEGLLVYLIREDGKLRIETDCSLEGLFSVETWRALLHNAGFTIHEEAISTDDRGDCPIFVCVKPG